MTSSEMPPLLSPRTAQQHTSRPDVRPPSPNYFGLKVDPNTTSVRSTGSSVVPTPWTPSVSQAFTTSATSSKKIVASKPNHEALLPRSEDDRAKLSKPAALPQEYPPSSPSVVPPLSTKSSSRKSPASSIFGTHKPTFPPTLTKAETVSNDEAAHSSRSSPKRLPSTDPSQLANGLRRQSPADFNDPAPNQSSRSPTQNSDEKPVQHSIQQKPRGLFPNIPGLYHSNSITTTSEVDTPSLITPQRALEIFSADRESTLMLDLRVSTQYAQAHVKGALNLCIPTTLLKRSSYNVSRLSDTFKDESQKAKFSSWRGCKALVMYDNNSTQLKEASNCVNILKKFTSEGWQGQSFIIRGGFMEASKTCPSIIDRSGYETAQHSPTKLGSHDTDLPPVMGGCPMPAAKSAANPFFANIRQNMDLIDGVGQMPVQCPTSLSKRDQEELPQWLRKAVSERDQGKTVSDKFLHIEKREQRRMQLALSGNASPAHKSPSIGSVKKLEIAGIEKGTKNRYNNIFPFEHSRVRLKDLPRGACDYVNANFLQTSMSHKKYIATQGPIPATFDDFWNMVWQRDVRVIVMLTAESEGGQVKAHNYWNEKHYGPVKINYQSEHKALLDGTWVKSPKERPHSQRRSSHMDLMRRGERSPLSGSSAHREDPPTVIVRKLTISHDGYPFQRMREVTHLQYTNWPDFGTPAHPLHLLKLVEQCDGVVRATGSGPADEPEPPTDRPVLVHCSAGCGRTGTFCTVDTVIDVLKRQRRHRQRPRQPTPMDIDSSPSPKSQRSFKSPFTPSAKSQDLNGDWLTKDDIDLVERAVEEFRVQRLSTVQSLRQYVLCYESILEWIAQLGVPKTA